VTQPVTLDDSQIRAHLEAQAGVPDGFVKLADGTLRPVGGTADNAGDDGE
jgi:hypothetical protein